jgi:hypothetical protein
MICHTQNTAEEEVEFGFFKQPALSSIIAEDLTARTI